MCVTPLVNIVQNSPKKAFFADSVVWQTSPKLRFRSYTIQLWFFFPWDHNAAHSSFHFPYFLRENEFSKKKKKKLNLGDFFSRNCKAYSIINSNAANVTACLFTWNFFQPYSSFPWCALIWRIFHQIKTEMKKKITIWQKTLWKITLKGYYAEDLFVKPHNKNLQILTLQMDEFLPLLGGIFGWFTLWAKNFVKSKRSVEKREIHTHFSPFNAKILILSVEKQEIHS